MPTRLFMKRFDSLRASENSGQEILPDWKIQLREKFSQFGSEALGRDLGDQNALYDSVSKRDTSIDDLELLDVMGEYKVSTEGISFYKKISMSFLDANGQEVTRQADLYKMKIKGHFSDRRLPNGYAYKGGAARSLLLRSLEIDPSYEPRDIDVVRLQAVEPASDEDLAVSKEFMPDDFATGHGVEVLTDMDRYFGDRDFTINECLATDEEIFASKDALLDTVRRILRITPFERLSYSEHGDIGPKMLSKLLRFYSEAMYRWGWAELKDVDDWEFEPYSISPFWLALQLDRAAEVNSQSAAAFVTELKIREQIPATIESVSEAGEYLVSIMSDSHFYFRHAPVEQFQKEFEDIGEDFEKFPLRLGHGRALGQKRTS